MAAPHHLHQHGQFAVTVAVQETIQMSMSVEAIAASGAQVGRALTRQFIGRVARAWRTSESAPSSADFGPYDVDDAPSGTLGVPIAPGPLPAGGRVGVTRWWATAAT